MLVRILVIVSWISISVAQDYSACVRQTEACATLLNAQNQPRSPKGLQGQPGRRGPKGDEGLPGAKGDKGEPGDQNNEKLQKLGNYIISLEQRLNNTVAELQRTLVQHEELIVALQNRRLIPCAGWYSPNNGFQYQLSSTKQNWQESRMLCQQIGGDLAALGIKNFHMRKKVADNLFPTTQWIWIGMSDLDREGHFNWIDGNPFNDPSPGWKNGDPNNARNNEHCVGISHAGDPPHLIYDIACDATLYALCEKSVAAACQ